MTSRRMLLAAFLSTCCMEFIGGGVGRASETPHGILYDSARRRPPVPVRETRVWVHNRTERRMKVFVIADRRFPRDNPPPNLGYDPERLVIEPGKSGMFRYEHRICGEIDHGPKNLYFIGIVADDENGNRKVWGYAPGGVKVGLYLKAQFADLTPDYRVRHIHFPIWGLSNACVYEFRGGYFQKIGRDEWILKQRNGRVTRHREVNRTKTTIELRHKRLNPVVIGLSWVNQRLPSGKWVTIREFDGAWFQ